MTDYNQLNMEYKRELLVNFQSAMSAFLALEQVSGAVKEEWIKQIFREANNVVDELTDQEVEKLIKEMQDQHHGVTQPWVSKIIEMERQG